MAKQARKTPSPRGKTAAKRSGGSGRLPGFAVIWPHVRRWLLRIVAAYAGVMVFLIILFRFVNPPITPYMLEQSFALGHIDHRWVPMDQIAPVMARSAVAAEDSNFCEHWGFDIAAIRAAAEAGATRGGSTIDQQVVKNVFLWQGHSWPRKALEAIWTPVMEIFWPKRRILEVYLNVAEFDRGAFGIAAGAARYYQKEPAKLTSREAALLAAVLPNPDDRNAARPSGFLRKRAAQIEDGAATIRADGRAACFEH